jgi:hypothetical protein
LAADWSRDVILKVVDSRVVYDEGGDWMKVSEWFVPEDMAEGRTIRFYLEMVPQLRKKEPRGHFIFHKYRLLGVREQLSASVDAPTESVERALAADECPIAAAIVASEEVRRHVRWIAPPIAERLDEINELIDASRVANGADRAS